MERRRLRRQINEIASPTDSDRESTKGGAGSQKCHLIQMSRGQTGL